MTLEDRLTPRVTLVAQSRRRYDPSAVRAALKVNTSPEPGGREVYRFKTDKPLDAVWPEALVWLADEWTVVVAVPPEGRKAAPRARPPASNICRKRCGRCSGSARAGRANLGRGTGRRLEQDGSEVAVADDAGGRPGALEKMRSFAAEVQLSPEPTVRAAFEGVEPAAAERLEKYLVPSAARQAAAVDGIASRGGDLARELATR
jgi:hypothetical protein